MQVLKTIVVGIDFSAPSEAALAQAVRLAQWNRAAIKPVHVVDMIVSIELEAALSTMALQVRPQLVAEAQRHWPDFAKRVPGAEGLPLRVEIDARGPGLVRAAEGADLVVIGAFANRPDTGLGTVAAACVRHAKSDVLLAREGHPGPFKTIVAAVDFSPTSLKALESAVRVATQDSAKLHIVHVFMPPWEELMFPSAAGPIALVTAEQQRAYEDGLRRRLREFVEPLAKELEYLKPELSLWTNGGHRSGISAFAREKAADLIVLGTRGRTNLRDMLLGSTAERALRDAPCAVLAVRA